MAGKINNETLALNIDINGGDKVRKEMNDLKRAIQDTKTEIAELTQKQKELAAQGKRIRPLTKRLLKVSRRKAARWLKTKRNWTPLNGSSR